jgi:5-methylcytosine-specific restriction endonuclease McrA
VTVTRGTTNGNARGSSADRAARRAFLLTSYAANVKVDDLPTCRCYRCGILLTEATITVDRIVPGCLGGTYRRNNIRPACAPCNSSTGGALNRR